MFSDYLPEEYVSACNARKEMHGYIAESHSSIGKLLLSASPLFAGLIVGYMISSSLSFNVAQSILTVCGVLAGFVVTLMLFTGRVSGTEVLNLEQSREYRQKVAYLLWSQIATLTCYLFTIFFSIAWIMLDSADSKLMDNDILASLFLGGATLSLVRTLVLPYQIFELHNFSLTALIESKKSEVNNELEDFKNGMD